MVHGHAARIGGSIIRPVMAEDRNVRDYRIAAVIPVFNHEGTVGEVVRSALLLKMPVIVVDDGSTDTTFDRLQAIDGITICRHRFNRGKGAALLTGLTEAAKQADWAVTFDADGQHYPEDVTELIAAIPDHLRPIVVGARRGMRSEKAPWTSRFGRGFSNLWVRIAGGPHIADTQSGFRIYPIPECLHLGVQSQRFQFELEILVRAGWKRLPVVEAPVRVSYSPWTGRISHFHPLYDFLRDVWMFTRLITYRIVTRLILRG